MSFGPCPRSRKGAPGEGPTIYRTEQCDRDPVVIEQNGRGPSREHLGPRIDLLPIKRRSPATRVLRVRRSPHALSRCGFFAPLLPDSGELLPRLPDVGQALVDIDLLVLPFLQMGDQAFCGIGRIGQNAPQNIEWVLATATLRTTSDVDSLLGAVGFRGTKGKSNDETTKSCTEVLEEIDRVGGIAVPAHVDGPKGLFAAFQGTTLAKALECRTVFAIQVDESSSRKPQSYKDKRLRWTEVVGSEASPISARHHLQDHGRWPRGL
jgi:hypothetical protein